ncbi:MAG: cation diffusion facilitator family transporter [Anaerolineae bacterium]
MEASERVGIYSVAVNLFLVGLKVVLAVFSGSLALAADAVHSSVDVVGSLVVLGGLFIARRKSKAFPYGLYKVENVVAIVVAFLIFLAGYEIAREAWQGTARVMTASPAVLAGAVLAVVIPLAFSRYEARLAKTTNSPSLAADSRHFQTDVLSSAVVLIALAGSRLGWLLDRIGAAVVVVFIARAGWELLADGMRVLLDASLDVETLAKVRGLMEAEPAVAAVESLTGRNAGRYCFLEAEVTLRTHDLDKAHAVSQRLEDEIRREIAYVDRVLIHYEPTAKEHIRYAIPLIDLNGTISQHFGKAPYFALVTIRLSDGEIERQEIVANPHTKLAKAKGIQVAEWLVRQKVDAVLVKENLQNKGPEYVFANAGVEIHDVVADTLAATLATLKPEQR